MNLLFFVWNEPIPKSWVHETASTSIEGGGFVCFSTGQRSEEGSDCKVK